MITAKTWTSSLNNALNAADQRVQYRELFFAFYRALIDNGWILEWSCDGVTASAADNIPNAAAVTIGLNGTQPISYFVVRAPANFVRGGGTVRIMFATNASNASATPQACIYRISRGPYTLNAVPLQNVPTATVAERALTTNLVPHGALTNSNYALWTTTDGDVFLGVKPVGVGQIRTFIFITAPTTNIDNYSVGPLSAVAFCATAAGSNAITTAALALAANIGHLRPDGDAGASGYSWSPILANATTWTGGVDSDGEMPVCAWWFYSLGGATFDDGRELGYVVDVWTAPGQLPFADTDTTDADAMRLVCVGGGLMMPTTFAQLPFL